MIKTKRFSELLLLVKVEVEVGPTSPTASNNAKSRVHQSPACFLHTTIWVSLNQIEWAEDNYNDMCYACAKGFLDSDFYLRSLLYKIFEKLPQNFTYSREP